jgi:hypothetical protein
MRLAGGCSRTRTCGPLIKSQLLYQLSYTPKGKADSARWVWPTARMHQCPRDLSHATKMPGGRDMLYADLTLHTTEPTTTFHGESEFRATRSKHDVVKPQAHRGSRDPVVSSTRQRHAPDHARQLISTGHRAPRLKKAPEMFYRCRLPAPADGVLADRNCESWRSRSQTFSDNSGERNWRTTSGPPSTYAPLSKIESPSRTMWFMWSIP